jgi:hypothetical protein
LVSESWMTSIRLAMASSERIALRFLKERTLEWWWQSMSTSPLATCPRKSLARSGSRRLCERRCASVCVPWPMCGPGHAAVRQRGRRQPPTLLRLNMKFGWGEGEGRARTALPFIRGAPSEELPSALTLAPPSWSDTSSCDGAGCKARCRVLAAGDIPQKDHALDRTDMKPYRASVRPPRHAVQPTASSSDLQLLHPLLETANPPSRAPPCWRRRSPDRKRTRTDRAEGSP